MNSLWLLLSRNTRAVLLMLVVAGAIFLLPNPAPAAPATREIALDMRQFEFSPARIEINRGDHVILTLRANDVVHGFYLDGYGLNTRIQPGINQRIEFVAERTGKFRYRCSVTCGPMHPFMIGEFVVGPNTLIWRIAALLVVVTAGVLFLLRTSKSQTVERIIG